jgi:hypothetical protein
MLTKAQYKKMVLIKLTAFSQSDNDYVYFHRDDLIEAFYDAYQAGYVDGQDDYIRQDS